MKYNINHIDTCNASYFRGHHLPTFSIEVNNTTTLKDVKEAILNYYTTEHIEDLCTEDLNTKAFKAAVEKLFEDLHLDSLFDDSLDAPKIGYDYDTYDDYDCYADYAFFTIEEIEEA